MEGYNELNDHLSSLTAKKQDMEIQLESVTSDINTTTQKMINILSETLVGKFVKVDCYGIIHSVVDLNTVKVMRIGLTINNKLDRTCKKFDISEIKIVSEDEVSKSMFDSVKEKYKTFIKEEIGNG